jgi:hypothetical protein
LIGRLWTALIVLFIATYVVRSVTTAIITAAPALVVLGALVTVVLVIVGQRR